jgi:hypothetical protein
LPDEDAAELAVFFESVHAECRSDGQLQSYVVDGIAWDLWRLRRIPGIEAGLLTWQCYQLLLNRLSEATETYSSGAGRRSADDEARQTAQRKKEDLQAKQHTEIEFAAQAFLADAMGPRALSNIARYQTAITNDLIKLVGLLAELRSLRVLPVT